MKKLKSQTDEKPNQTQSNGEGSQGGQEWKSALVNIKGDGTNGVGISEITEQAIKKKVKLDASKEKTTENPNSGLNKNMMRFVDEYMIDGNATRAHAQAGYPAKTSAARNVAASHLLRKVKVRAEIDRRLAELKQKSGITVERVLEETGRLAHSDLAHAYNKDGTLKNIHDIPIETRAAISSIESFEEWEGSGDNKRFVGIIKKVTLWSKPAGLGLLKKHFNPDANNINVNVSGTIKHEQGLSLKEILEFIPDEFKMAVLKGMQQRIREKNAAAQITNVVNPVDGNQFLVPQITKVAEQITSDGEDDE